MTSTTELTNQHTQVDTLVHVKKMDLAAIARRLKISPARVLTLLSEVRVAREAAQQALALPTGPTIEECVAYSRLQSAVHDLPAARHGGGNLNAALSAVQSALEQWRAA